MNGTSQVNEIKNKVKNRLNLLRILSFKKHWQRNERTLINIYKSLVRSITDYSANLSSFISNSTTEQLERIQNTALRIIFKINLSDKIASEMFRKKAKVEIIKERQDKLLRNYFTKARDNQNELILELINNFRENKCQSIQPNTTK